MLTCPTELLHNSKTEDLGGPELKKKKKKKKKEKNQQPYKLARKINKTTENI